MRSQKDTLVNLAALNWRFLIVAFMFRCGCHFWGIFCDHHVWEESGGFGICCGCIWVCDHRNRGLLCHLCFRSHGHRGHHGIHLFSYRLVNLWCKVKIFLLVWSASWSAITAGLAALSGKVTRLVAVIAGLGSTIISTRRATSAVIISARRASIVRGIVLSTLLAELNWDALSIEIFVVEVLNCLLGIFLILVLAESIGAL